jgi:hypothetical protein
MLGAEARRAAAFALVLLACAVAPLLRPIAPASAHAVVWPEAPPTWHGQPLRPLALAEVEQRFADRFPGRVLRATDGDNVLVFRDLDVPTRMLHPAADCYRGLGYRILDARLERDAERALWRCFEAERAGRRVRVCERIVDADGASFTDASSWFWAAQLGRSHGPWRSVTVASPL